MLLLLLVRMYECELKRITLPSRLADDNVASGGSNRKMSEFSTLGWPELSSLHKTHVALFLSSMTCFLRCWWSWYFSQLVSMKFVPLLLHAH